jgi:hypothetical protein
MLHGQAEKSMQSANSHAKWDPLYHYFLSPIILMNALYHGTRLVRHPSYTDAWAFVVSLAMVIAVLKLRMNALKVQDRLIRLEERLRLKDLLPVDQHGVIGQLTEDQLIGLRFASDGEVAELATRAAREKLTRKQIKETIRTWRADEFRV